MSDQICAYEKCDERFTPRRPHQRFHAEPCRYAQWELDKEREESVDTSQRVDEHPLQSVRDQQATDKHKRDLGGLIKQAIVDTIRSTGECHADDLVDLYPEGERDLCRRLATAQFGSMCAPREGHEPLLVERERRKSRFPNRKGGKSGVYVFSEYGREQLVGLNGGFLGGPGMAAVQSGESKDIAGVGVDHHGDGEGAELGRVDAPAVGVDSGESPEGAGSLRSTKSDQGSPPAVEVAAGTDSPDLFSLDGARTAAHSMFDPYSDAA